MGISDIFSTSSLVIVALILISVLAFTSYIINNRMAEQDHKLKSMVNVVSLLAQDLHNIKHNRTTTEQCTHETNLEYPSQLMDSNIESDIINVSDDDTNDSYEECNDDFDSVHADEDEEPEDEDEESEDDANEDIKVVKLNLTSEPDSSTEDLILNHDFEEI